MNTISFDRMPMTIDERGTKIDLNPEDWMFLRNFRKADYSKIHIVLTDMMNKLRKIRPEFNFEIRTKNAESNYNGGFSNKIDKLVIELSIGKFQNVFELDYPRLEDGNSFILNGSLYVPILFLERAPIDRIGGLGLSNNKIFLNFLDLHCAFDFKAKQIKFKKEPVDMNVFFTALFYKSEYRTFLNGVYEELGEPFIGSRKLTFKECKLKVLQALEVDGMERFEGNENTQLDEFFDNFVILDYVREMFIDYYNVDNFKDMVRLVWKYYKDDIQINMSDVRNRRVVMTEYLIAPLFEFYKKILFNFISSNHNEYLIPKLSGDVIINEGFRENMHAEQLFNTSLPYLTPLIHKISQNIVVISSGKVPKTWTSNNPSAMGILCPISVSAQDMGSNLVASLNTKLNFYGRLRAQLPHHEIIQDLGELDAPDEKFELDIDNTEKKGNFIINKDTGEILGEKTNEENLNVIR